MVKVLVTLIKFGQNGYRKVCEKDVLPERKKKQKEEETAAAALAG